MAWIPTQFPNIKKLTTEYERAIRQSPLLNIDTLVIPSPYILDKTIDIDYEHSYVWDEKGELLGYLLVYATPDKQTFHIYKLVTNPFGRGKGIGSAFLSTLVQSVAPDAHIYLFVWEKLLSSIDFFKARGFTITDLTVFRKMRFHLMSVTAGALLEKLDSAESPKVSVVEELSKVRHDVKKSLKVLSDMTAILTVENFNQVSEDINRETTSMLNTLNMYEDNIHLEHKVSLKELITERVIPFIEAVDSTCEVRLMLKSKIEPVNGSYNTCSRALINIVSNALDAIKSAGRRGLLKIVLEPQEDMVVLAITDNGTGIPAEKLEKGPDQIPLFVGKSTKGKTETGEGVGTKQIYATFGADHVEVTSEEGTSTTWTIRLKKSTPRETDLLDELYTRYVRMIKTTQKAKLTPHTSRNDITIFIWQLRQMELFSYDLLYHFSRYNNIRDIFSSIMMYRFGGQTFSFLKEELSNCRIDNNSIRAWLLGINKRINKFETCILRNVPFDQYKDVLFQSYGQVTDRTMIFTLDPESGRFFTTDRKLAEHLDFVPYLQRERDELLRGELIGDVRNVNSPIYLGVWSIKTLDDMYAKLKLIQKGAQQLLEMRVDKEKRIAFYNTTYNTCESEIDTFKTVTLGEMVTLKEADFERFIRPSDSGMSGILAFD